MYNLSYLPLAKNDLQEIMFYVTNELNAPKAAANLIEKLECFILRLREFPYSCRIYRPCHPLEREYRIMCVKNYVVFYIVIAEEQTVEIQRILYGKMDLSNNLH